MATTRKLKTKTTVKTGKRPTKAAALRNRLWSALLIDGRNGVRKGSRIWTVLEMDGWPLAVTRLPAPRPDAVAALRELGVTARPMRAADFVTPSAAIAALREIAAVVDGDRDADREIAALRAGRR